MIEAFPQFITADDVRQRDEPRALEQFVVVKGLPADADGRPGGRQVVFVGILGNPPHDVEGPRLKGKNSREIVDGDVAEEYVSSTTT